jgi:hypothetical protein
MKTVYSDQGSLLYICQTSLIVSIICDTEQYFHFHFAKWYIISVKTWEFGFYHGKIVEIEFHFLLDSGISFTFSYFHSIKQVIHIL